MAERVVSVKVNAKVDGAVAGLRKVRASVDDLTKADVKKPAKAFGDISNKAALMGGVVALGIGKAISSFADFDAAMSGVAANSGATGAALDSLRDMAIKLGADTQFSATEAAQGINELAKAGVSAADIMNGGIKGALDLAAAGQIGVAEAAETTASALNQFQQDGSQAVHVADLLSNAANAAQGGVSDMGQALAQAGVAANAAGLNIDETTTLLALFAKAGLIGSDAGTSLKTMMLRLSAPTEKAAATLEELGISAYDAQGNFIGAEVLLGQMAKATKGLSTEQRNAAFNIIFGTDAIRAASIAAAAGADGYASMNKEVTKAGGAAENAAKLTDNLKGDLERLGGALDTAFIQGGSAANGALRTLVQGLGGVVDVVSKIPAPVLLAGAALGGIALALPKGISVYKDFTASLDTLGISMGKVTTKAPRLASALKGLQGAAVGATTVAVIGGITNALTDLAAVEIDPQKLADGAVSLADFNKRMAETSDLGAPLVDTLTNFDQVIEATFNAGAGQNIDSFFKKINSAFGFKNTSDIEVASQRFTEMDKTLSALVSSGHGDQAAVLFKQVADAAARQGVSVADVRSKLPGYASAIADAGNAAATAGPQMDGMSEDVKAVQQKADDAKKALQDLQTEIEGFGSPLRGQRAAQRDYAQAVLSAKSALKDQRDEFIKGRLEAQKIDPSKASPKQLAAATKFADAQIKAGRGLDIATKAGQTNQANLDGIADRALNAASKTFELTHSQELAAAEVQKGRTDFIDQAKALGLSGEQAAILADNMKLIPKDVKTAIGLSGVDTANSQLDKTTGKVTTLGKTTAKPQVAPFINNKNAAVVEARMDQLSRNRSAFISISAGLTGAASGLFSTISGIGKLAAGRRAAGGPIFGPGTGTSDTAGLYALSNNEHVLTAAEVAAAGGHGAIFALRKAILAGGVQYRASGGPATRAYRAASVSMSSGMSIDYDRLADAVAARTPRALSVYSGEDAKTASREAIRDDHWRMRRG